MVRKEAEHSMPKSNLKPRRISFKRRTGVETATAFANTLDVLKALFEEPDVDTPKLNFKWYGDQLVRVLKLDPELNKLIGDKKVTFSLPNEDVPGVFVNVGTTMSEGADGRARANHEVSFRVVSFDTGFSIVDIQHGNKGYSVELRSS